MTDDRTALARVESTEMTLPEQLERARPEGMLEPRVRQTADVDMLQTAFAEAWMEFPIIPKNRVAKIKKGPVEYEYRYADLSDVKRLVDPVLKAHGLAFMCIPTGGRLIGRLIHPESAQWLEGDLAIVPPDSRGGCQALGSALTYTRRYLTSNMLNLSLEEGEDDDGAAATMPQHEPSAARDPGPHTGHRIREPAPRPDPAAVSLDIASAATEAGKSDVIALMRRADPLPDPHRHVAVAALVARLYALAPTMDAVRGLAKYAHDCGCSSGFITRQEERRETELQGAKPDAPLNPMRELEEQRIAAIRDAIRDAATPEAAARALSLAREAGDRDEYELAFAERIAAAADNAGDEAQLLALEGLLKQARLKAGSAHLVLASTALEQARHDLASGE